jgi:hypothetical protein
MIDVRAARLQRAQEKEDRAARVARIVKAAKENPDLCIELLAERFGTSLGEVRHVLGQHGIRRERDGFSNQGRSRR